MADSVNISAVAARAGVSTATVSRFLNGKNVSPPAAQRILTAVRELSYSPSLIARSLKLKKTMMLGAIIPDITNPFFPAVVKGVEDVARRAGYTLMLFNAGEDPDREWECLQAAQAQRCEGVLLIKAPRVRGRASHREQLEHLSIPIVYVDRAPDFSADTVTTDNVHVASEAVRHLIQLGHARIAAITVSADIPVHADRVEGYRRAMRDAGLPVVPEFEVRAAASVSDGYSAAAQLLALQRRPSAVFVTSSSLTIGTMAAIGSRGLECPRDISVVGYDNYEWQEVFRPRLTTVSQPTYLMGERAAELLLERIRQETPGPPQHLLLRSTLVVRESSGLCPAELRA